jgi:hypothetical protein
MDPAFIRTRRFSDHCLAAGPVCARSQPDGSPTTAPCWQVPAGRSKQDMQMVAWGDHLSADDPKRPSYWRRPLELSTLRWFEARR